MVERGKTGAGKSNRETDEGTDRVPPTFPRMEGGGGATGTAAGEEEEEGEGG